jgi:GNAT superfamily N-acetyltransferase
MEAVRPAEAADGPRLEALAAELVALVAPQRGGALLLGSPDARPLTRLGHTDVEGLLADPARRVLVGTLDGAVVAAAACHVEVRPDGHRWGVLDGCYVEEAARGVGLGHLLATSALAWLRHQGCAGVDGVALPGDRVAKQFFEASGFKARLLTMHRTFD